MNRRQRLEFAVRLAGVDLTHATTGELMVLQETFARWFLHEPGDQPKQYQARRKFDADVPILHPLPHNGIDVESYRREDFEQLQRDIRQVFGMAVPGAAAGGMRPCVKVGVSLGLTPLRFPGTVGRSVLTVIGPSRDVFLHMLFRILSTGDHDPVQRCLECHTWFVRERRQKYCSIQCTRKANNRAYQKTQEYWDSRAKTYNKQTEKERAAKKAALQTKRTSKEKSR